MKLIGIGDNTVDDYTHLRTLFPGGNALNVAVHASMLGCESAYLGVFGSDAAAGHMQQALAAERVDLSRCHHADGPSGRAMLALKDGERVFTGSNGGGVRKSVSMAFIFDDVDYLQSFSLAHTSTYSFINEHLPRLSSLVPLLSYDFSDDFDTEQALSLCEHIDIACFSCPNRAEDATRELLEAAVSRGARLALATRGVRDTILYDGKSWFRQAPQPVKPVDTLGAGDAFISAFLVTCAAGLAEGEELAPGLLEQALARGAGFAAEICRVQGAFGHGLPY